MNNNTGFADGPNETELLIADITAWKEARIEIYTKGEEGEMTQLLSRSEIKAFSLLTRAQNLL